MIKIAGKPIAKGVATGALLLFDETAPIEKAREKDAAQEDGDARERARMRQAIAKTIDTLRALSEEANARAGKDAAAIFDAQAAMLEDPDLIDACDAALRPHDDATSATKDARVERAISAEDAVTRGFSQIAQRFRDDADPQVRRYADDILELRRAVLRTLSGTGRDTQNAVRPYILYATTLSPAELLCQDKRFLKGVALANGGADSHTAILARSLGLPMIAQCGDVEARRAGCHAALDGDFGALYLQPEPEVVEELLARGQTAGASENEDEANASGVVRDDATNAHPKIYANIDDADDAARAMQNGASGVGLYRTELLYLRGDDAPSEDAQVAAYRAVLERCENRPVILRTADLGADRAPKYLRFPREENPALGLRGVRYSLRERELFYTQLRAVLRASVYGDLSVMFPMLSRVEEFRACKQALALCKRALEKEGAQVKDVRVGAMIETPAAALCADAFAAEAAFLSIGTNDLTQFTYASDRLGGDAAHDQTENDDAIWRLIGIVVKAANRARIPVGVCGEMAANPDNAARFFETGVTYLSIAPQSVRNVSRTFAVNPQTTSSPYS